LTFSWQDLHGPPHEEITEGAHRRAAATSWPSTGTSTAAKALSAAALEKLAQGEKQKITEVVRTGNTVSTYSSVE
jgi:hypothetical protein